MKITKFGPRTVAREFLSSDENIRLLESCPLIGMHLACLALPLVGFSKPALWALGITYFVRVFALTGGYHRYFAHKTFKTSRGFQLFLAFLGSTAGQLGPLWWASHHRHHHQHADKPEDAHSPRLKGFWRSHVGWIMCRKHARADSARVADWMRYPELKFLDRYHVIGPLALLVLLAGIGALLQHTHPHLGTSPVQMVAWGFFLSTVLVYHVTFCVNSLTHMFGRQRYETGEDSRNSWLLALITMGEGWHNNHHHYSTSARQGFYPWEIDMTYYVLLGLQRLGFIWDIRPPAATVYDETRNRKELS